MRIEWAIPCRYCEVAGNEVSMIGGNANAFVVPDLPTVISLWVALRVVAPEHETGPDVPHSFQSRVLSPQMTEIPDSALEIEDFRMELPAEPGWEAEQVVPSFHSFLAEDGGTYTIEMKVDERATTVPISVMHAGAA